MKSRIPSLDGLRAISITLVILCHFGNDIGFGDPFNLGALGVRIFFVISGFLITGLLLKEVEKTDRINLARFYFRRTLRIFPPFYFYLAVMLALSALGISRLSLSSALPALTYTSNYWSRFEEAGYTTSHTWSLATEEQFYLLWPFVLVLLRRRLAAWSLVAVVALLPLLRVLIYLKAGQPVGTLSYPHLNADHLATGCLLAFASNRLHSSKTYQAVCSAWLVAALPPIIFLANALTDHPSFHRTIAPTLINLCVAVCIDWAVRNHQTITGRILNARPVAAVGVLSYSLYLWQQPFLHLHGEKSALVIGGGWQWLAWPPASFALMITCACASYFLIERPALRLRERIETTRASRSHPARQPSPPQFAADALSLSPAGRNSIPD